MKKFILALLVATFCLKSSAQSYFPAYIFNAGPPVFAFSNSIVIPAGQQTFVTAQANDPIVILNPIDPTKLIAMYDGCPNTPSNTVFNLSIGYATASTSNPLIWTPYSGNPQFSGNGTVTEGSYIRVTTFYWDGTRFQMYYSGWGGTPALPTTFSMNHATATADANGNPTNWIRDAGNPQFTTNTTEQFIDLGTVTKMTNGSYFMAYVYKHSVNDLYESLGGAVSANGTNGWTRTGDLMSNFRPNTDHQWHQVYGSPNHWQMSIELGLGVPQTYYTAVLYETNSEPNGIPTNNWQYSLSAIDNVRNWPIYNQATNYNTATPSFFNLNGNNYQFCQFSPYAQNYATNIWSLLGITCNYAATIGGDTFYVPPTPSLTNVVDTFQNAGTLDNKLSDNGWLWSPYTQTFFSSFATGVYSYYLGSCGPVANFGGTVHVCEYIPTNPITTTVSSTAVLNAPDGTSFYEFGEAARVNTDYNTVFQCYRFNYVNLIGLRIDNITNFNGSSMALGSTVAYTIQNGDRITGVVSNSPDLSTVYLSLLVNGVAKIQTTDTSIWRITNAFLPNGVYTYNPGSFNKNLTHSNFYTQ